MVFKVHGHISISISISYYCIAGAKFANISELSRHLISISSSTVTLPGPHSASPPPQLTQAHGKESFMFCLYSFLTDNLECNT